MSQYVYWHAPLWEVLLVASVGLAFLGWLVVQALRRPSLSEALSAINPTLNEYPLFFFDRIKGITCLNEAADRTLRNLPASRRSFLLDALTDALLEAYEEARIAQRQGWPESDYTLIAVPLFRRPNGVIGVLALVAAEMLLPPAERIADEHITAGAEDWLALGPTLRLHRARPVVQVRRVGPNRVATWQQHQLSHAEDTLLRYLLEHQAEVQAAEMLFRIIWPDDEVDRYGLRPEQKDRLRRLVYQLRRHVEPDPRDPRYVCTAHGIGYVLYRQGEEPITR